jgi:homoserine dehydrogenase
VPFDAVHREGITAIDKTTMDAARHAGYVIKLLAVCERITDAEGTRPPAKPSRCGCIPR